MIYYVHITMVIAKVAHPPLSRQEGVAGSTSIELSEETEMDHKIVGSSLKPSALSFFKLCLFSCTAGIEMVKVMLAGV